MTNFVAILTTFTSPVTAANVKAPPAIVRQITQLIRNGDEAFHRGDFKSSETNFAQAIEAAQANFLHGLSSLANYWLVRTYAAEKKYVLAEKLCHAKIIQLKQSNEPAHRLLDVYCSLGFVQIDEGKIQEARNTFEQARELSVSKDLDTTYRIQPLIGLAVLEEKAGHLPESAKLYEEALEIVDNNNFDFSNRAGVVDCLATIYPKIGRSSELEDLYKNVITNYEYNDRFDQEGIARTFCGYGDLLAKKNRLPEAEQQYKKALGIYSKFHDESKAAQKCRSEYASLLRKLNRPDEAKQIEDAK